MPRTPIEYRDASAEVRAVFDDIKRTRQVADVNNFWKYLAHDPMTLSRTWASVKEVMTPGALDALTKEMIYVAVSVTNGCGYCIASHSAAARKAGIERGDVRRAFGGRRHGERDQPSRQRLSRADRPGVRIAPQPLALLVAPARSVSALPMSRRATSVPTLAVLLKSEQKAQDCLAGRQRCRCYAFAHWAALPEGTAAANWSVLITSGNRTERRRAQRRRINRVAKISARQRRTAARLPDHRYFDERRAASCRGFRCPRPLRPRPHGRRSRQGMQLPGGLAARP